MSKEKNIWGIWHYVKSYKFNSIFIKNFLLIVIPTVLPIVLISASIFNYFSANLRDEIKTTNINGLTNIKNIVEMTALESDRLSLKLTTDEDISSLLFRTSTDTKGFDTFDLFRDVQKMMSIITITNDFIGSVYIYFEKSDFILTTDGFSMDFKNFYDREWKDSGLPSEKLINNWVSSRKINKPFLLASQIYLSSFRTIFQYHEDGLAHGDGMVIVNIDIQKLKSIIENANDKKQHNLIITDKLGMILYSSDMTNLGENISKYEKLNSYAKSDSHSFFTDDARGVNQIVSVQTSSYNQWKYMYITPASQYSQRSDEFNSFMLFSIVAGILIAIVSAFFISVRVFQPIKNMVSLLDKPNEWASIIKFDDEKNFNEFKYVAKNILKSLDRTRQMEEAMTERLDLLRKAQSVALQSQINPHFLYNTMETINWKAMGLTGGENEVSDMLTSLSQLLRLSLETENNMVTIETEIEHANLYLNIQNKRYKEKFQVIWNIDPQILNNKIIKLTIQPLLENAIYHGIKPKKGTGKIIIKGTIIENKIVIEIVDNGVGMTDNAVEILNLNMKDSYITEDLHIGMKNVNQRIKLFFGEEYGLTIASEYKKFTLIKINIPIVE